MAFIDLYTPRLSLRFEFFLDSLQEKLRPIHSAIKRNTDYFKMYLSKTSYGKWYSKNANIISGISVVYFCIGISIAILGEAVEISDAGLFLYATPVIIIKTLDIIAGLATVLYIISFLLISPIFIIVNTIHFMNLIGKGKALSGIGLAMSFYGIWSIASV